MFFQMIGNIAEFILIKANHQLAVSFICKAIFTETGRFAGVKINIRQLRVAAVLQFFDDDGKMRRAGIEGLDEKPLRLTGRWFKLKRTQRPHFGRNPDDESSYPRPQVWFFTVVPIEAV